MEYSLDLKFSVKKQISMIMADWSWGHAFRGGNKRSLLAGYAKN